MYNQKADVKWSGIIKVILAVITFLIISLWVTNLVTDTKYEQSLIDCRLLFNNINGKEVYFNHLTTPTTLFENSFKQNCPSKEYYISNKQTTAVTKLSNECWNKFGQGNDFLGSGFVGSICLYCGQIKTDEKVEDLNVKIANDFKSQNHKLLKTQADINLNNITFNKDNLPNQLLEDQSLNVFYIVSKSPDKQDLIDQIQSLITGTISNTNTVASQITWLFSSSDIETASNILITTNKDAKKKLLQNNCQVFIPLEEFD